MLDAQGAVEGVPDGNTLVGVLEGLVDDVVEEQVQQMTPFLEKNRFIGTFSRR